MIAVDGAARVFDLTCRTAVDVSICAMIPADRMIMK